MNRKTSEPESSRHGGIQVIARSAAIMRALGAHPGGLSLAEIAREVGLPRSTVQRIVCALEAEFLVEPRGPDGGFRLGPAVGKLLHQTHTDIVSIVRPLLEQLVQDCQETAFLARICGDSVHIIERTIAERELRVVFPVGVSVPLHATSAGKAILSGLQPDHTRSLLAGALEGCTAHTVTDIRQLLAEIATVKERGYATDFDEYRVGISSCAVPVQSYLGIFSLGLILPSARIGASSNEHIAALRQARLEIERRAGANPIVTAGSAPGAG